MLQYLARRWLRFFSGRYQYDTTYMEELLDNDLAAFLKFSTLGLVSSHRRGIPVAPWHAARIRAAMWEDCGPCVQLVCNMALEAGVDPACVAAVVTSDLAALQNEIALIVRFTEYVLARDPAADGLREQVRQLWGTGGLISLAIAISTSKVYPSVKYVLGHGHACSRVQIARHSFAPAALHGATPPVTTA